MSLKRVNELFDDYTRALERLLEALEQDITENSVFLDGAIQRFEFTFEVAWKLAKVYLHYIGLEAIGPRNIIKESFAAKIISDGGAWIDMLEDRNKTSHIYNEKQAREIYIRVKDVHYKNLSLFKEKIEQLINE